MSADAAPALLKQYSERISRLTEEKKGIQSDITDVYTEAHSQGIDKKALREVVKLLDQDAQKRREHQELVRLYGEQLGLDF
ncbi:MAG: hypothetical protein A2095_12265 [Sphingomonadales bacterium GWF1_63_6]|nr:MAG: hypothetical protein A2095_12265 [Sphingomonadales bacterium GWF1_63_6]